MNRYVEKLADLPTEEVKGHQGFVSRSLLDLQKQAVTVRVLNVTPGGVGPVPQHRHEDAHFFWVIEGNLELEIDGQIYTIPSGSCIKVPPDKIHQLRCSGRKEVTVLAIKWVP